VSEPDAVPPAEAPVGSLEPSVALRRVGDDLVVEITGELDGATVPVVAEALRPALPDGPYARVLVDLGQVSFCDSSGLHLLLRMPAMVRASGRTALVGTSPQVARVVQLTGTAGSFDAVPAVA
jgi:anti-anti-sigma factor